MPITRTSRLIWVSILLLYLGIGVLFAIRTPSWQAPDEPAHYNYIAQVAGVFRNEPGSFLIPIIQPHDWNSQYLDDLKANRFAPYLLKYLPLVQYEDHQPPLYYWLSTPIFLLTNGNLTALRLVSLAWGIVTVVFTYRIGRLVFPSHESVAFGAMALVAFLPQHLMILSSVNNDALAGAILSYLLYLCLRYRKDGTVTPLRLGLILGCAILTKTTIYFMVAVVALTILLRWLAIKEPWTRSSEAMGSKFDASGKRVVFTLSPNALLWQPLVIIAVVSGIFAAFWWGRNINVYGFPDFLGLRAHDAVVIGQPRTADLIAQVGFNGYISQLTSTTFNSFWGQFGWMGVPMIGVFFPNDTLPYTLIQLFLGCVLVGLLALRFKSALRTQFATDAPNPEALQVDYRRIVLSTLGLAILVFLYYNTQFVQFQGRYLFSAIIPFALFVALGWDAFVRLFNRQWQVPWVMFLFAVLDIWLIWRVLPSALGI